MLLIVSGCSISTPMDCSQAHFVLLNSFDPTGDTVLGYQASLIQHMQKALRQMNRLLDSVVNDISGKTGITIIRAILNGQVVSEIGLDMGRWPSAKHFAL